MDGGEHGRHGLGRGDDVDEVIFEIVAVAGLVLHRVVLDFA